MTKKAGCDGSFDGLCCRMVIETKRVFDGCRFVDNNVTLNLTTDAAIPDGAKFVSARVLSSEFVDYTITDNDSGNCFRVTGEILTRLAVTYCNGGVPYTVTASFREQRSVLLKLPTATIIPYSIEVQTAISVLSGAVIGERAVAITGCILQIIKVTAPVDILVPTYGYCKYPPCTGCVCNSDFGDRIFPSMTGE